MYVKQIAQCLAYNCYYCHYCVILMRAVMMMMMMMVVVVVVVVVLQHLHSYPGDYNCHLKFLTSSNLASMVYKTPIQFCPSPLLLLS